MATDFSKYGSLTQPSASPSTNFAKYGSPTASTTVQPKALKTIFDPTFSSSPSDTGLQAGFKAAGNLPSSALRFGKGIYDIATNPITTAKSVASVGLGGFQKLIPGTQKDEAAFNQFASAIKDRYGSFEKLQKTATEDPFGFGTDVVSLLAGGATLAGRGTQAANLASKTARTATAPVRATASGIGNTVSKTATFATSQATGLSPTTIREVITNPSAFARSSTNPSRTQIAEAVGKALDTRLDELSDVGKGYENIRKSPNTVSVPENVVETTLSKYGIKVEDGKVVTNPESRPLTPVDKLAIERFISSYGQEKVLSANGFLNVREALSQLAKYEDGKSNLSNTVARDLRSAYDALGKQQLPQLAELDSAYAPERKLLSQLKKDILTPRGELKDGAISKIANITGKAKDRVRQIVPDIDNRIRVLKAVEDIEAASGLKVGTYTRAAIGGGGIVTGNIPVIIGAIISQPEVAVPLLRAYGYTGQKAAQVLRPLRIILEDINTFQIPSPVIDYFQDKQPGLSVKPIRFSHELADAVRAELEAYDAAPVKGTVMGEPNLISSDADFRLIQLQEKIAQNKSLSEAETMEAYTLLQSQGITPTPIKRQINQPRDEQGRYTDK